MPIRIPAPLRQNDRVGATSLSRVLISRSRLSAPLDTTLPMSAWIGHRTSAGRPLAGRPSG